MYLHVDALVLLLDAHGLLWKDEHGEDLVGSCGTFSDGIVTFSVTDLARGLAVTKQTVFGNALHEFVEIAYRDTAEQIWRHVHPTVPPGPFERWMTDESHAARKQVQKTYSQMVCEWLLPGSPRS